jgi:hypothetical protein
LKDEKKLAVLQKFPLKGHCWGRFALGPFPAGELQILLPSDLELAPQSYTPKGQHPLLFMFNNTWLYPNPYLIDLVEEHPNKRFDLNYFEFIAMLPCVQFKDNKEANAEGPYCFLPVLYLNNELAVWGGRVFWEFNKILTAITVMANGNYTCTDIDTGFAILSGETALTGPTQPGSSYGNFIKILPILQLPVIEHGLYGYVSSIYEIDLHGVNITPAQIGVFNHQSNFFPRGSFNIPSIATNLLGAFHMNYEWELSYIKFIKF